MNEKFKEIRFALQTLEHKTGYYSYWEQLINNLESRYRMNYQKSNRDRDMAKGVEYLADIEFPDKKIILWAATIHLLGDKKDIASISKQQKQGTGYYLKNKYKETYYHLAFIPASGTVGLKGYLGIGKKNAKAVKGSIEKYIRDNTKQDYAFMSMKSLVSQDIIKENNINKSLLIGTTQNRVNVANVVDGYFYMKEEYIPQFSIRRKLWEESRKE
ncbi:hypothetical protein AV926_00935 [Myroides marinus]|uniref:Uncharacterized protein n=1 Tax=Myroides marinus TaxID=703342 RepID=A0A161SDU4_9FLAO|nr:erythromycin esterase family protein [Myroides marinus]KZE78865.1 hypothetical protein AV926_00935 [Myroides marinus]